jgi:hypothetical protein
LSHMTMRPPERGHADSPVIEGAMRCPDRLGLPVVRPCVRPPRHEMTIAKAAGSRQIAAAAMRCLPAAFFWSEGRAACSCLTVFGVIPWMITHDRNRAPHVIVHTNSIKLLRRSRAHAEDHVERVPGVGLHRPEGDASGRTPRGPVAGGPPPTGTPIALMPGSSGCPPMIFGPETPARFESIRVAGAQGLCICSSVISGPSTRSFARSGRSACPAGRRAREK